MTTLHSFKELACACCGSVDDVINAEIAKFGTRPLTKFAVHFTANVAFGEEVKHVNAPTPELARRVVADAYKPETIIVHKIKQSA